MKFLHSLETEHQGKGHYQQRIIQILHTNHKRHTELVQPCSRKTNIVRFKEKHCFRVSWLHQKLKSESQFSIQFHTHLQTLLLILDLYLVAILEFAKGIDTLKRSLQTDNGQRVRSLDVDNILHYK